MKITKTNYRIFYLLSLCSVFVITGCVQMSEKETDVSAGMNGGFEISKNNLPVNWLMYTPNTVPDADFKIILDNQNFKEGNQSLKFEVKSCTDTGGWGSPGFTNEFFDSGAGTYKLSFWVKNDGTKFQVQAGGVSAFEGDMRILTEDSVQFDNWKFLEYKIMVPQDNHLRIQLNILKPGTFWIDDIRIKKII